MNTIKKIILTCLCVSIFSVSFGQQMHANQKESIKLKKNSVQAVEFLTKELKLDDKQRVIFMNAFAEYANNMQKAIKKSARPSADDRDVANNKRNPQKATHQYMLRFSKKRDEIVKASLKKKQLSKYDDLIRSIHPFTLDIREKKKK